MPKIDAETHRQLSIDELVGSLEATGSVLGERATALSVTIGRLSDRLEGMDGKTAVSVESNGTTLSFARWAGDWGVWLSDSESGTDDQGCLDPVELAQASIIRKAKAFPLLLELISAIEAEQKRQLSEIEAALALVRLEAGAITNKREGK